ncbi:MAG: hypothetical protein ABFQ62_05485 [Patescibacteria group bacterium]
MENAKRRLGELEQELRVIIGDEVFGELQAILATSNLIDTNNFAKENGFTDEKIWRSYLMAFLKAAFWETF